MNINTLKIIPLLGGNVSAYKLILYITHYSFGMVQSGDGFNGEICLNTERLAKFLSSSSESVRTARNLLEFTGIITKVDVTKDIFAINPEYSGIQTRDNDTTFGKTPYTKFESAGVTILSERVINKVNNKSDFVWDESVDGPLPF